MSEASGQASKVVADLMTDTPSPYLLRADTLAELRDQLPRSLIRTEWQPKDPPAVVEVWLAAEVAVETGPPQRLGYRCCKP